MVLHLMTVSLLAFSQGIVGIRSPDHQARLAERIIRELSRKNGVKESILLVQNSCRIASIQRSTLGQPIICVSTYALARFSDLALRGLLGHEFGHLLAGHINHIQSHDPVAVALRDDQANAYALKLVGQDAVQQCLYESKFNHDQVQAFISRAQAIQLLLSGR